MLKTPWIICVLSVAALVQAANFSVEGNSLRSVIAAQVNGATVLYSSELDGGVSCTTLDGKNIWRNPTGTPAVLFEIEAVDVNGDGSDDLLSASGDGSVTCWNSDGSLLWRFASDHKVRFSEVAVVKTGASLQIFAGGNDYLLYELNALGQLVSQTPIQGVVRKIEVGDFLKDGQPSVFLMTYGGSDKFRWEFFGLLDPKTRQVVKELSYSSVSSEIWSKLMVNDLSVADIDQDGRDDLLFFGHNEPAIFVGMNGEFEEIARFSGSAKDKQRYAHGIGTCLLPVRPEIVLQYGGKLYVCDLKGNLKGQSGAKYRGIIYSDLTLIPETGQLVGAGQVGGGNGLYFYPLNKKEWWKTEQTQQGRMLEVESNLATLYKQALEFTPPSYQKRPKKPWIMVSGPKLLPEVEKLDGAVMLFANQVGMQEKSDRRELVAAIGEVALKKDRRMSYNLSQDEIVAMARELEKAGTPFTAWAGHGNDPFITPIDTLEKVLEVAPNTCYGFIYAEMDNTADPRVIHFVKEYVPRLAAAMRVHGRAKLYFRYKNIFWAANAHAELWKEVFISGKYSDILVPAAEDTNARTQELNFAGRVGLFAGGYVNDFAMRLIDDNPTSWRPLAPGGQRSVSPYLRNGALLAAYGARYGVLFNIGYLEDPGMNILYALMKSGALPLVEPKDILSIGSWHLIENVNEELVDSISDGHNMKNYSPENENAVISCAQVSWCGASIPDYDFSKQALGVDYRWLNFMPLMPHGMVPIAPIEYALELKKQGIGYTVSDWKNGMVDGTAVSAKEFGPVIGAAATAGAEKLPVLVSGASWSAIRLDDTHIRLVLVDPGYVDPQERDVTVRFQHGIPVSAIDILSKEKLIFSGAALHLTVPAGSLRFVDLRYSVN